MGGGALRHRATGIGSVSAQVSFGNRDPFRERKAEPVHRSGLEEEGLDDRRLSRPAMADDGDVPDPGGVGHGQKTSSDRFASSLVRSPSQSVACGHSREGPG